MTEPSDTPPPAAKAETPASKASKKPVWVVSRSRGLEKLSGKALEAALGAGARLATARDLAIAGVDPKA